MTLDADVLLTGASGFLGSALLHEFRMSGRRLIALTRNQAIELNVPSIPANLLDAEGLSAAMGNYTFRCIVHLAASLPGKTSDDLGMRDNHLMTLALLALASKRSVQRFVLASGCNVYGNCHEPCVEESEPRPADDYAKMKLADEVALFDLVKTGRITGAALRISAPYGAMSTRPTVVSLFLRKAAAGETITVFGTGARQQHFVHEADVANAFHLACDTDSSGVFNISGPEPTTMLELARACAKLFGNQSPIVTTGHDPQENYRGDFPWKKAERAFGYVPRVELAEGLRLTAVGMGLL